MADKICQICGEDCSTRPRIRDEHGRYACQACVERRRAPSQRHEEEDPDASLLQELAAQDGGTSAAPDGGPCPNCGTFMEADAALCVACGYQASGGVLKTKRQKAKPSKGKAPLDAREQARTLAHYQRLVIACIGLGFLLFCGGNAFIVQTAAPPQTPSGSPQPQLSSLLIVLVAQLLLSCAMIYSVVRMALALRWNIALVVLSALLMFAPCFNLVALLVINRFATHKIKKAGYHVGLFGASV